jgi:hypothetical protein
LSPPMRRLPMKGNAKQDMTAYESMIIQN